MSQALDQITQAFDESQPTLVAQGDQPQAEDTAPSTGSEPNDQQAAGDTKQSSGQGQAEGKGKGAPSRPGTGDPPGSTGNRATGDGAKAGAQPPKASQGQDRKQRLAKTPADRLRPSGEQALARGIRQLEGLAQARRLGKRLPATAERRLRQDAFDHLDEGIRGTYGYNENTRPILSGVQKELADPATSVDERLVARLLAQLQRLRRESAETEAPEPGTADPVTLIDPAQLPPAYRASIQRYFEKLSKP